MSHPRENQNRTDLIRGLLLQRGYSLTRVAKELGVSLPVVSFVVKLQRRSLLIESFMIEIMGPGGSEFFPPMKAIPPGLPSESERDRAGTARRGERPRCPDRPWRLMEVHREKEIQ